MTAEAIPAPVDAFRSPPHDLQAERAVLGLVLKHPQLLGEIRLAPSDFYRPSHEWLWDKLARLHSDGESITPTKVNATLLMQNPHDYQRIGGGPYLFNLVEFAGTEHPTAAAFLAGVVHDHAVRRRILQAGQQLAHLSTTTDPYDAITHAVDTIDELAREQLHGSEPRSPAASLPILDWDELWAQEDEEEWIIEPLLPARRLVALYSAPKVGKSLLMLELAVGVAKGAEVLGVRPDRPRRVLYVDHENDPRGDVRTRLEAMGYGLKDLRNLCYLSYPVMDGLDGAQGAQQLLAAVEAYQCELVVIDTISRAVNGDENENDTWLRLYRATGKALKQAKVAMIRLDHSGKDDSKGMRGGSAKYGDVDAVWKLSKEANNTFKLKCTDHRFQITEDELVLTRLENPLRHKVEGAGWMAAADARLAEILEALARLGVPQDAGRTKAREALKEASIAAPTNDLARAIKHRKTCPEWARTGADHRTCPRIEWTATDSQGVSP
ncbi:AAA family ATPase [Kribbella sp. NPDC051587]|uniref:AAA family ATPase n=1 Tax=Kribbella sp. NPDC051587 TaxID=3364119 RepID=UPI00378C06D6